MSEQQFAYRCDVCDEDHAITPKPMACWFKDQKRLADLESEVRRIEARVMERRPTPPGVFPPMGRPMVPSEGQCAYPIGGGVVCLLPPGHDGAHGMTWASPAEAAIFERGGYVPGEIRIVPDPTVREGEMRATAYPTERGLSERVAAVIRGMDRPTCAHVPPGMSGLCHACRPSVSGLVVGPCACGTQTPHAPLYVCGPVETPTPAAMLGEAVALLGRVGDMVRNAGDLDRHIIATIDELRTYIEEAKAKRESEARLANCPRGIHDGPGSDACDCAAIAKAERKVEMEDNGGGCLAHAAALLRKRAMGFRKGMVPLEYAHVLEDAADDMEGKPRDTRRWDAYTEPMTVASEAER